MIRIASYGMNVAVAFSLCFELALNSLTATFYPVSLLRRSGTSGVKCFYRYSTKLPFQCFRCLKAIYFRAFSNSVEVKLCAVEA